MKTMTKEQEGRLREMLPTVDAADTALTKQLLAYAEQRLKHTMELVEEAYDDIADALGMPKEQRKFLLDPAEFDFSRSEQKDIVLYLGMALFRLP